jgi:hypothetical protein
VRVKGRLSERKRSGRSRAQCSVRRTLRKGPPAKYTNDMRSDDSSDSEGIRDGEQFQASLGIRMCAADPRYITHEGDSDRGDVTIPMSEVKKLISLKEQLDEAVATVWLTTAEMVFSLTDEPHMVICSRDIREGKVSDRYLAPAISKFAIVIQAAEECEPTMDPEEKELRR